MRVCAAPGSARRLKCERLLELLGTRLVSITPQHSEHDRSAEIAAWTGRYRPLAWVAVDDEPANLAGVPDNKRVLTRADRGLTLDDAQLIIDRLRAQLKLVAIGDNDERWNDAARHVLTAEPVSLRATQSPHRRPTAPSPSNSTSRAWFTRTVGHIRSIWCTETRKRTGGSTAAL